MLHAITVGEGDRPVVVLHGFLGYGRNLHGLAKRWFGLDPARRLWLPDLPGHGRSAPLPTGATLTTLAEGVQRAAKEAGLPHPLHIVGHSLGGRVGLAAAALAPESVAAVDLLDITPGPIAEGSDTERVLGILRSAPDTAGSRKEMREALMSLGLEAGLADWLLANLVEEGGIYRWRFDRDSLASLHAAITKNDLWPVIEGGALRTRLIRGGRSPFVSEDDLRRFQLAGGRTATVDAGHYVHVERGDEVAELLAERRAWENA